MWRGQRTAPPRQQTLMATLDCSYELLCKTERSVLRQLAIFVGSSSPDGARAILTHDGPIKLVPPPEVFKPTDAVGKARLPTACERRLLGGWQRPAPRHTRSQPSPATRASRRSSGTQKWSPSAGWRSKQSARSENETGSDISNPFPAPTEIIGHLRELATPGGLEPPTNSLEGCCSNPLSYGAVGHLSRASGSSSPASPSGNCRHRTLAWDAPAAARSPHRRCRASPHRRSPLPCWQS
jgi:hypothetical protein